jgi:hypothetical protein
MSFKVEVIADSSGQWTGNQMRFASKNEAEIYALDLALRWTLVTNTRILQSDESVNYELREGRFVHTERAVS